MKSPIYELIAAQATAAAANGSAATIAPGSGTSTLQVRYSPGKRPNVLQMFSFLQTTGFVQLIANSMHDTTRNFRAAVPALTPSHQKAWNMDMLVNSQETFLPTIGATAVAGDVESLAMLMEYDSLGGVGGSYIDAEELEKRATGVQTTIEQELTGSAAGWTGSASLTSVSSLLRGTREYAVLGITSDLPVAAISLLGPCTGNFRYGCPGDPDQIERGHQYFMLASMLSKRPMIPVLNSAEASQTQLAFLQNENNISPNITLRLALLRN